MTDQRNKELSNINEEYIVKINDLEAEVSKLNKTLRIMENEKENSSIDIKESVQILTVTYLINIGWIKWL